MIRLLIRLAIVALLANAVYRVGSEYLTYIRFRDDVRDAAMFKARDDEELLDDIVELAAKYDVPVNPAAITIHRVSQQVTVDGHYEKPIEIAPRYFYPWPFSWSIQGRSNLIQPARAPR